MNVKILNLDIKNNLKGNLIVIESLKNIPFEIKRLYYIFNNKTERGCHAHKKTKKLIICISGKCNLLVDNGIEKKEFLLNKPNYAILINEMIWNKLYNFTDNTILLVLANTYYDPKDYINDYNEYLKLIKNKKL